jgi:hypothetical protein
MFLNRANIGHANYASTAFAIVLVLSILFNGDPIVSAQHRQVELNHPAAIFSSQEPRQVELNHPAAIVSSQEPRQVELNHPTAIVSSQEPVQSPGRFRCTDGSLVGRGSDCPSDECPVCTNNHLVQCTPETFRHTQENDRIGTFLNCADGKSFPSSHFFGCHEFQPVKKYYTEKVFNNYFPYNPVSSNIPYYVSIFTNKNAYKIGENVEILLKNTGSRPLVFTTANSRLEIRNLGTGQSFLLNMPIPFVLSPEETNTITWNQHDTTEQQVNSGNYVVTVYWGQIYNTATFSVSGK